ncbi:protein CHROMOSOME TRANSMISSION FIDELITY 7-like [Rutidosis leptorrhynchoides]|uniref:protein CHROMOSOME TRANSMISSION FIDELITY 7-like n=1 Tax=Rutidosis leptorrhynchoides TaxID=125765 RepID=UPI003A997584
MQSKINSFFKVDSSSASKQQATVVTHSLENQSDEEHEEDFTREPEVPIIYTRRTRKLLREEDCVLEEDESNKSDFGEQLVMAKSNRILNKKRKYAQFHLDLGQSDFMFRNCKTCGFKFVPGDEEDAKLHKEFHKNYTHGIGFKGWRNERVIDMDSLETGRVILVLNDDPPAHINKVKEVIKMMEMELGDGWIFHKNCKVYLFISSQRVAGCLVAEPIKKAYRLISNSNANSDLTTNTNKERKLTSTTLKFGNISFRQEIVRNKRLSKSETKSEDALLGAIICEKDAVPGVCGIRAIWVAPSNRRKHVATHLLEATRKSFCPGLTLQRSQLAFSQPTNAGKLLASSYINAESFLVYTTNSFITLLLVVFICS